MAPRRSRNRRYRRFKRAYRKGGVYGVAKSAAKSVLKYYLNPEYKFLDFATTQPVTNTGSIYSSASLIPVGDTNVSRDGNSIKITSWLFRYTLEKASAATASRIRIIGFTDVSSAGTVPAVTDVLESASVISPMDKFNGARFKVLFDRMYSFDVDDVVRVGKIFKKMQHHIKYLDSTGNTTSLGQGPIYVLAISNESTNPVSFQWNSRMRFLDN